MQGQSQNTPVTVLLIDDDTDILDALSRVLIAAGYVCHCSATAAAALELALRVQPELVISDVNLSGASGLTLCEQIKQQPGLADVPVMFLSGAQVPDIIRRAHAAGGVYYLRKPFDPQVILELIDKALWMPAVVGSRLAHA